MALSKHITTSGGEISSGMKKMHLISPAHHFAAIL